MGLEDGFGTTQARSRSGGACNLAFYMPRLVHVRYRCSSTPESTIASTGRTGQAECLAAQGGGEVVLQKLSTPSRFGETTESANARGPKRSALIILILALAVVALLPQTSEAAAAEGACPNEAFRTGFGAQLPDCRAYEQASPPDKNGSAVEGFPSLFTSSEDGSGVTWFSISASAAPSSGGATGWYPEYLSSRIGPQWLTQRLFPPQLPISPNYFVQGDAYLGVTPDGRYAVAMAYGANCAGQGCSSLWVIDTRTEVATPIVTAPGNEVKFAFDGASEDGSKIFFETRKQLLPGAAEGVPNLYMWDKASGSVSIVGVAPGETAATPGSGAFGGAYDWTENEVYGGGALYGLAVGAAHAISASGDQIVFTAPEVTGELGQFEFGQLFLRRGLTGAQPSTVRLSEPNPGVIAPEADFRPAAFQEATPDGAHVFFLSGAKLTADANTGPTEEGTDLYRWDKAAGRLVDITPDAGDENGAQVVGMLGASESGAAGFFVGKGVLAPGGTANQLNIYRFAESGPGKFQIAFVATLNSEGDADRANWLPTALPPGELFSTQAGLQSKASRVDPSGSALLFTSLNPLTEFRNESPACGEARSEPRPVGPGGQRLCPELYLYSQATQKIACVSCNPRGPSLGGDAELQPQVVGGPISPSIKPAATFPRNLSINGQRVIFETAEPLVAADHNGGEGCQPTSCLDVYEWEAPGEGSCTADSESYSAQSSGCVYMISPGQSPAANRQASYFLDASANGAHIFIATNNPLVPADIDEAFDAYDVSIGGGLASQNLAPAIDCAGEECQGPSSQQPAAESPGSSTVAGTGNLVPAKSRCAKGKKKSKKSKTCKAKGRHHPGKSKANHPSKHGKHGAPDGKRRGNGGSR
jgi:hypothetical protein